MNTFNLTTPVIKKRDNLLEIFCDSLQNSNKKLEENSIIAVTSKIVSVSIGETKKFDSEQTRQEIITQEADKIIGKTHNVFLTEKNSIFVPNSGVDESNAEKNTLILLPQHPQKFCDEFREKIQKKFNLKNIGVILVDSFIVPKRQGITGVALACSGFEMVQDIRGEKDIFNEELKISQLANADILATTAQIFFGQGNSQTPFCVFQNPPVRFTDKKQSPQNAVIEKNKDLFSPLFT